MVEKVIFEKAYTRDYSMIIEEIWTKTFYRSVFSNDNPYNTIIIDYINDGVMEVWENKEAINWYKEELFKKNQEDTEFFNIQMNDYEVFLKKMKNLLIKKKTSSLKELKYFISLASKGMYYFLIFYYSAMDNRNSQIILNRAFKLRDEDKFFEAVDNFIRDSIEVIYPQTKGFTNTVLVEDLDDMPERKILEQRYKNYIVDVDKYSCIINLQDFSKAHLNYEFIIDEVVNNDLVKGQIAFKGKVTGKVRILKRKNQISEFKEGEVLLSPMTTPDFVPAMKRAAAIVTDEGGIVCHAAILARELKIPCVIGTKFATKVFKDGDQIEVDAEKGIVRKLN